MKVADIRPDDLVSGQAASLEADLAWLAARRPDFVHVACPACGTDKPLRLYEKHGIDHVRCPRCETQYADPRPSSETLAAFYAQSANYAYWAKYIFPASQEVRRREIFRPRAAAAARLVESCGRLGGDIVEVGAAYGLFCDEARRTGAFGHIVGIEPTPALAEACRGLGIEVIEAPYEKVGLDPPVDLIAAFEVIEHLYDPAGFLNWCYEALKAGGAVLLTCPNIAGFETLALGRHSGAIDHEHINLFTPQSLALLAERCGFREIDVTTPGRLDVELVQRAIDDGTVRTEDLDPIVQRLMAGLAPSRLQEIVREAGLSSNMQLAARR